MKVLTEENHTSENLSGFTWPALRYQIRWLDPGADTIRFARACSDELCSRQWATSVLSPRTISKSHEHQYNRAY